MNTSNDLDELMNFLFATCYVPTACAIRCIKLYRNAPSKPDCMNMALHMSNILGHLSDEDLLQYLGPELTKDVLEEHADMKCSRAEAVWSIMQREHHLSEEEQQEIKTKEFYKRVAWATGSLAVGFLVGALLL
jgi:hypothetical protein